MTRKFAMLATVAALSLPMSAPSVSAMDMEYNMLTGAVFNAVRARGLSTENIDKLTLGQIAIIKGILSSGDSESKKTQNIQAILNRVN